MDEPAKPAPAKPLAWQDAVERIGQYVVKISTPHGFGTGFLFAHAGDPQICGIATAAHVIERAHTWEDPIRIDHFASGKSKVVHVGERAVQLNPALDTAALIVAKDDIPFPDDVLPLILKGYTAKIGIELGWVGFPALAPDSLCFFSGRVSTWLSKELTYLVDGVAIHGVSGGPAFHIVGPLLWIVGVVSAYAPNRLPGETLPGVCVIRDVQQFQTFVETIKSLQEAKEKETTPIKAQEPSPEEAAQPGAPSTGEEEAHPTEAPS